MSLEITALVSKILYTSPDQAYVVAEFIDVKTAKKFKASGHINVSEKKEAKNQKYVLFGDWQIHAKYGNTFVSVYCEAERPHSIKGLIQYLSNNVANIGEITAQKLLNSLEIKSVEQFIEICKNEPQKIMKYFQTKPNTASNIITSIMNDAVYRSIMIFLHEHNIPSSFAKCIYDTYKSDAIKILSENPYKLITDIRNVGFIKADAIGAKLGIAPDSFFRITAAFVFSLEKAQEDGHCCLPRDELVKHSVEILNYGNNSNFSFEFILDKLRYLFLDNKNNDKPIFYLRSVPDWHNDKLREIFFYLPVTFNTENKVTRLCLDLIHANRVGEEKLEKLFKENTSKLYEYIPHIPWNKLSDEQLNAVKASIYNRIMILTGGPGCGKTFVLKAIYETQKSLNRKVALCAPTGLAAKKMTLSIGAKASTIHRLLGLGQTSIENNEQTTEIEENTLKGVDIVIVDEASMLSLDLLSLLLDAVGPMRRIIFVGDADQLPSIGPGNCLRDLIASRQIEAICLTKIFRQSSESPIPLASRDIILGAKPKFNYVNSIFDLCEPIALLMLPCKMEEFHDLLIPLVKNIIPSVYGLDNLLDTQILVPMRKTDVGQEKINLILQKELNPPHSSKSECILSNKQIIRTGDKVIQTRNNYTKKVFNGDLGYCKKIEKLAENDYAVTVDFYDGEVILEHEEVDDLQLCYAMTIHKSQGSEFPLCIIPMFSAFYVMLDRNLLYTAITRASKYVIFIGEEWAIRKAINTNSSLTRYTSLAKLLSFDKDKQLYTML